MSYDLFEVKVACFIFNKNKELLLMQNRKHEKWGILGGHLDKGEQIIDTIHREAKEEANIKIKIIKQFDIKAIENYFIISYACKYNSGKIKLQASEIKDYKWAKLSELKNYDLTFKELPSLAKKSQKIIFEK